MAMFTRTQSLQGVVAVGLGEVRQSSQQSAYQAAGTAGALLANYLPHFRGAFRFSHQFAAIPTQCTVAQQFPQIAAALGSAQESSSADVAKVLASPAQVDVPSLDQDPAKVVDASTDVDAVRASVMATLVAREYRPRMQRLEDKVLELYGVNQQLQVDAQESQQRAEKSRELNRRLCREVNDSRTERTEALEELDRHKKQLKDAQLEAKKVRSENETLRKALEAAQLQILELCQVKSDSSTRTPSVESLLEFPPGLSCDDASASTSNAPFESDLGLLQEEDSCSLADTMCTCNSHSPWGCTFHRIYSDGLLLAHRDVAARISKGPPGLEFDIPPGLEQMQMCGLQSGLHTAPAW